jgi:hypothetical protein
MVRILKAVVQIRPTREIGSLGASIDEPLPHIQ